MKLLIKFRHYLPAFIIVVSLVVSSGIVFAQSDHLDIEFPIEELGGCVDENDCHDYCDDPVNMLACLDFAEKHNLMNKEEIDKAREFGKLVILEGGPGGCADHRECDDYCSDVKHLNECIEFADRHGHTDEHIEEGRKLKQYLDKGGRMPGGCDSEKSCEEYCSDFKNFRECREFSENVGFEEQFDESDFGDEGPDLSSEEFDELLLLMERGETPGGCSSHDACERYCSKEENIVECVDFGVKAGFIDEKEAQFMRETGGKGPGGCVGRECETFCNKEENQVECHRFAIEHGLIGEEDKEMMREHLKMIQEMLSESPPELKDCFERKIGRDRFTSIMRGDADLVFVAEADRHIDDCFTDYDQKQFGLMMEEMPKEVSDCLASRVGRDIDITQIRRDEDRSRLFGDSIEECFKEFDARHADIMHEGEFDSDHSFGSPHKEFHEDFHGVDEHKPRPGMFFEGMPPFVEDCIKDKVGDRLGDFMERADKELVESVDGCIETHMKEVEKRYEEEQKHDDFFHHQDHKQDYYEDEKRDRAYDYDGKYDDKPFDQHFDHVEHYQDESKYHEDLFHKEEFHEDEEKKDDFSEEDHSDKLQSFAPSPLWLLGNVLLVL